MHLASSLPPIAVSSESSPRRVGSRFDTCAQLSPSTHAHKLDNLRLLQVPVQERNSVACCMRSVNFRNATLWDPSSPTTCHSSSFKSATGDENVVSFQYQHVSSEIHRRGSSIVSSNSLYHISYNPEPIYTNIQRYIHITPKEALEPTFLSDINSQDLKIVTIGIQLQ
ncbi:hypothetical protein K474DRAFT_1077489 [Panus rudis PR-1116 ss-1]|nr:hypothetical protein K474DRAFT_1077489 [Panus rudis PR-1116 ss-1]